MKYFVFPGNISPDIRRLGAEEVPYARTPDFGNLVNHCHLRLASLAQAADSRVLSFTASGTGALEALLGSWGPRWRRLLVLHSGTFGHRWFEMANHLGLPADELSWPLNQDPPWSTIEATLATGRHDAVMAVHHETSTGERLDLARLGALCRSTAARLLVDAIGSFLADPFSMDAWNVDAAVLSSQKGLCLPPGLAFLLTSPQLGPPADRSLSFYFDARRHLESFTRGQPPWSPAAQLYAQLDRRLEQLPSAPSECQSVAAKAAAFRSRLQDFHWSAAARHPSACLTAIRFASPATDLVRALAAEGWWILPSPDPCLIRVAHLGQTTAGDHVELAGRLRRHAERLGLTATAPPP